ncbi:MAG: SPASM domain-containing protein, partial [Clostridiales Family XIII bacterium]|nr:SPASM domain-containing protein [Clostridiales Family XIII bacterium]
LYAAFNRAHIYNKEDCAACWAKFYCSGGCHANAWHENGDILRPYALGCALEKKRLECAIGIRVFRAVGA